MFRSNSTQAFIISPLKTVINIFAGREHIKGRTDAEQDHLYLFALRCQFCSSRIVGTHANVTDDALFFQLSYACVEPALHDLLKSRFLIHKVDHSQVNIAGIQPFR